MSGIALFNSSRATQEPFFTTKSVGKGTGLGLSMVQGLAQQSHGRLVFKTRVGEGTTAEIWLPVAEELTGVARRNAQCEASLALDRSLIVAAVSQPKYEAKIGKHEVECRLAAKDDKDTQTIKFSIDPVVTFENGKAVKAALHWGNVSGSASAKTALWSATAVDNAFNVLQGDVLEQINEFFGPKCDAATSNPLAVGGTHAGLVSAPVATRAEVLSAL